jgi:hypothetical protein
MDSPLIQTINDSSEYIIEYALGKPSARGSFVHCSELPKLADDARSRNLALYASYYAFPVKEVEDHLRLYKTIQGYEGTVAIRQVVVDIDAIANDTDGSRTQAATKAFVERITNDYPLTEDDIQVYFSGRGYHIHMGNIFDIAPGKEVPILMKQTMEKLFPEGDSIYDKSRLLRVPNTINERSQRYKIPIMIRDLYHAAPEYIQDIAKQTWLNFAGPNLDDGHGKLKAHVVRTAQSSATAAKPSFDGLTNFVTCTQIMHRQGPQSGTRHQMILRMASSRRRGGMPYDSVVKEMQDWVPAFTKEEVERLVRNVFETPLEYGCNDQIMKQYCSDKCAFFQHKNFGSKHQDVHAMEEEFQKLIKTDFSKTSFDMREIYPESSASYRMLPGEMVVVIGDTKVGKTAFVQNIVTKLSRMRTLYVSTEVGGPLLYRRFIQMAHRMTKEHVEQYYMTQTNSLSDKISHIKVVTEPQFITDIYTTVKSVNPQIVVIDTTDGIRTRNSRDPITTSNDIALQIRELATSTNTIVIAIHHISKSGLMDPHTYKHRGLTVHSGKGSSTLEQKADKIIGIEADPNTGIRTIRSLAARDEGEFTLRCLLNTDTFVFEEIPYDRKPAQSSGTSATGPTQFTFVSNQPNLFP